MYDGVSSQIGDQYAVPGLLVSDHTVTVPLDYSGSLTGTIDVFYRIVVSRNKQNGILSLPFLLYLQGGPGSESPRPTECGGWLRGAVNHFRVVLMDQRGTGLSSAITCDKLVHLGAAEYQAKYLMCFRADSIVRDAEAIRTCLGWEQADGQEVRWSLLGQSFGGFCCTTYLSKYPESLSEVMITGGIPPKIESPCAADEVYRRLFRRVLTQNTKFYSRFPMDAERARRIVLYLTEQPNGCLVTPAQNVLSPRSFQLLGLMTLGFSGGFERLHYMLEGALDESRPSGMPTALSQRFLKDFDFMSWDTNPLYALLHESIYCQGGASRWTAHRVRERDFREEFDAVRAAKAGQPVMFTGEMVFPWMFEEFRELRKVKAAADLIASESSWPTLYDKGKLNETMVPVASASYFEDMFVDFELAQETVQHINGVRQHVTNEWLHDGIRENGAALLDKLLNLCRNSVLLR